MNCKHQLAWIFVVLVCIAPRPALADEERGKTVLKSELKGKEKYQVRNYFGRGPDEEKTIEGGDGLVVWVYEGKWWNPNDEKNHKTVLLIFGLPKNDEENLVKTILFAEGRK